MRDLNKLAGDGNKSRYYSPRRLTNYFINGLIIIIPLAITIWLVVWLFDLIDGFLAPVLDWAIGRHIPGLSFAIIIVIILLIGYFGVKIGHRKAFDFIEERFMKIPYLGAIYGSARQIINSFSTRNGQQFLEVALVEFPRKGIFAIGFVTASARDKDGKKVFNVFIPTAPTPAGGFLQIVPESQLIHTSMSISDAMKLIISMGYTSREDLADMLTQVNDDKLS